MNTVSMGWPGQARSPAPYYNQCDKMSDKGDLKEEGLLLPNHSGMLVNSPSFMVSRYSGMNMRW